ncbi:MAG TPA: DUF1559 domain-containing protein, partial [Planctomycetes bacterium]|nr:DUF1559 domain-containing protein [Planctomycetota bacterium]
DKCRDLWGGEGPRGVFGRRWYYVAMAEIKDGTSNTVAMSEQVVAVETNQGTIHGDYFWGGGFRDNPAACLAHKNGNLIEGRAARIRSRRGKWWSGGGPTCQSFNTILPPNSIGCNEFDGEWGWAQILPPDSYHPGGVNVAMADGSVRFITDTINTGNLSAMCWGGGNRYYNSPYGVWGALGSMAGGEAVSSQ